MRHCMVLCVLLLAASLVTAGMEWDTFSEVPDDFKPGADPSSIIIGQPGSDALTFYTNRTTFESAHPGLTLEAWDNTLTAPGQLGGPEPGPWDYLTNNTCFAPGGIEEGVYITAYGANVDLVVLGVGFLSMPCNGVGPNTFTNNTEIGFFAFPTRAFGVVVHGPMGATNVSIEVFGTGGSSLGTSSTAANLSGVFWGVYSDDEDIDYIEFVCADGDIYSDLQFGYGLPLERTTWGAIKTIF